MNVSWGKKQCQVLFLPYAHQTRDCGISGGHCFALGYVGSGRDGGAKFVVGSQDIIDYLGLSPARTLRMNEGEEGDETKNDADTEHTVKSIYFGHK